MSWQHFEEDRWDEDDAEGRFDGDAFEREGLAARFDDGEFDDEASALSANGNAWEEDGEPLESGSGRWPLSPRDLYPRERWLWFEQLWADACMLRERYRLSIRSGWWEDGLQVEALAAFAAWVERYDSGEWDDPTGKLGLLFDLERVGHLLRDGMDPFYPERARAEFLRFLIESGCQPPPNAAHLG